MTATGKKVKKSAGKGTRRKHTRKNGKRKVAVMITVIVAMIAIAGICAMLPWLKGAGRYSVVRIPSGATYAQVEDSIAASLGKDYARHAVQVMKMLGCDPTDRYGSYEIPAGTSALMAGRKLAKGARQPLTITINGFRSSEELARRIALKLDMNRDSVTAALQDPQLMQIYGLTPEQSLALFVEDSYDFYWNTSPLQLIKKIGKNYQNVWNDTRRNKAKALGLTPAEVMTICSIVDEETNATAEKGAVGRLYINRLQKGMKLQADPTVRYAVGDFTIRRVTGAHLKTQSPYNTYLHSGLPPGPIRTTSVATIDAVLDSEPSDYLYMCAKEDFSGTHNFAADYSEHQANAARYRKALDEKGVH